MPYSQILALIVALSLIVSAPLEAPTLSPLIIAVIWLSKVIFWYGFIFIWTRKNERLSRILPDRIVWFSNILIFIDLFVLNAKWFFPHPHGLERVGTFNEIIGLFLYFLYIIIGWAALWRASSQIRDAFPQQHRFIMEKGRLILPALVPYIVAGVTSDLITRIGVAHSEIFFTLVFISTIAVVLPPATCKIWGCTPLPASPLRGEIEAFLLKRRQRVREIMLWPAEGLGVCTAAVLGIIPQFRYILLTPCLLQFLNIDEIKAVLAHEMQHIKKRHMIWYVIFLLSYVAILYRLLDPVWAFLLTKKWFLEMFIKAQNDAIYFGLVTVIPFTLSFILYFRFIMGYFMRNFEREADAAIFETDGHPMNMISALEKVAYLAGNIRENPSWHHYSIKERVEFLDRAYHNPDELERFKKKIDRLKVLFLVATMFLIALPTILPKDTWQTQAKENLTSIIIDQLIKKEGESPDVYAAIGGIFLEKGDYERAEHYLKEAMRLAPKAPDVLNNLAWLYATSKDPRFFKPKLSLRLAKLAFQQKKAPYIMDTLAEAYFVNGYIKEAILLEKQILSLNPPRRRYYEGQLKRFMAELTRRQ